MTELVCDPPPRSLHERNFVGLVREVVLPSLEPEQSAANAVLRDRVVEGHATSSWVRMLQLDGSGETIVVRAFFRWFNPIHRRGRFERFKRADKLAALGRKSGVRIPETRDTFQGIELRRWIQYWIALEEFVEGVELRRRHRTHVLGYFDQLAGLHNVTSARWGVGEGFRGGGIDDFAMACATRDARRALSMLKAPGRRIAELAGKATSRFDKMIRTGGKEPFALIHGDARMTNALCDGSGNIWLIDFVHSRFALAGVEFLDALTHSCASNGLATEAARVYFARLKPSLARQIREDFGLFAWLASLGHLTSRPARRKVAEGEKPVVSPERIKPPPLVESMPDDWDAVVAAVRNGRYLTE